MIPFDPAAYISAAVVPVVMISACGLLTLALYNRLSSIVTRLRTLLRERAEGHDVADLAPAEAGAAREDTTDRRRLHEMLDRAAHHVLRRARLVRAALAYLLGAMMCLALCSLTGGVGTVWQGAAYVALAFFVAGLLAALLELRLALRPVEIESRVVVALLQRREKDTLPK
jgi:hypothetical protein